MEAWHAILVEDGSRVAEARRVARQIAQKAGLGDVEEQIAIAVTEACTNQLKHAKCGQLLLHTVDSEEGAPLFEMLALDKGPGMENLQTCISDGYSTAGSPGHGLGAIIRLSTESDFYSVLDRGTAILARWGKPASQPSRSELREIRVGAVTLAKPGEEVCGDSWSSTRSGDVLKILVADGLGHGMAARLASAQAVRQLHEHSDLAPKRLIEVCNDALRPTRGAAVAAVQIDTAAKKLTYCGIGNLCARIFSGSEARQHLVSVNGTAGHRSERLQEYSYSWPDDGLLVFHSDGLVTGTGIERYPGLSFRDPALIAGVLYRDFKRGHDDATVVVAKAA